MLTAMPSMVHEATPSRNTQPNVSHFSGVYFPFNSLPKWMQDVAAIFPLKWMCQGLRSVFLPDRMLIAEPAHSWELGKVALVLVAWLVGSLILCLRTFRWQSQGR